MIIYKHILSKVCIAFYTILLSYTKEEETKMKHVVPKKVDAKKHRIVIIHHNDMDGFVSAMIAFKFYKKKWDERVEYVFFSSDYNDEFDLTELSPLDTVVIVDYSVPVQVADELLEKTNAIVWIDHHVTAIAKYSGHKFNDVAGYRSIGLSASELTWLFFFGNCQKASAVRFDNITTGQPIDYFQFNNTGKLYSIQDLMGHKGDNRFPIGVRKAGLYDTFRFTTYEQYLENMAFSDGFYTLGFCPMDTEENIKFFDDLFSFKPTESVAKIIQKGTAVVEYKLHNFASLVKRNGFACKLRKFEDIKAIAINTDSKSSFIFETVRNDYEVGIVFNMNKEGRMNYSIYRLGLNPTKNIPVNKIAETFGGGGHADAAGFSTNGTLVVERVI